MHSRAMEKRTFSAMQLKKGLQKGELTYLATLKGNEDKEKESNIPKEIVEIFREFEDIMSPELPISFHPRGRPTTN